MELLDPRIWIRLVLLAAFLLLVTLGRRLPARTSLLCLGLLTAGGFVAYFDLVRVDPATGRHTIATPPTHYHEFYHYYLGAKYFRETGYRGLYEATVVADYEDDPRGFRADAPIRDLGTNRVALTRGQVVEDLGRIKAPFTLDRWDEFKSDVGFFRALNPPQWHESRVQIDHGYNGTPLSTALLGLLAKLPFGDLEAFIRHVRWLDVYLVLLVAAVVARYHGWNLALVFLFLWSVNPLNDFRYIGFSYLRYGYLVTLALGIVFFDQRKLVSSGVCFALSTLLRIFPGLFVAGLLACDLAGGQRRSALRDHRAFYIAFAATLVVLGLLTSTIRTPDRVNGWVAFYERMTVHASSPSTNRVGLKGPFVYSHSHNAAKTEGDVWLTHAKQTFAQRRLFYYASAGLLLALAFAALSRRREGSAWLFGFVAIFGGVWLACYYYAMLAVLPLVFRGDRRVCMVLAGFLMASTLTESVTYLGEAIDLAYVVHSALVLLLLAAVWALARAQPPLRAAPSDAGPR